jgi:hypothetical protein
MLEDVWKAVGQSTWDAMLMAKYSTDSLEGMGLLDHIRLLADDYCETRKKMAEMENGMGHLVREKGDLQHRLTVATEEHATTVAMLKSKHEEEMAIQKRKQSDRDNEWDEHVAAITEEHEQKTSAMEASHEAEVRKRDAHIRDEQKKWMTSFAEAERMHKETLQMMTEKHHIASTSLKEEHGRYVQQLKDDHESELRKAAEKLAQSEKEAAIQRQQFKAEALRLEQKHRDEQARLEASANATQTHLKNEIRSRNKALVVREKATGLTDGELRSMFLALLHEVDGLARLSWTSNRSAWTDQLQSELSDNPKRLQKQILLETIWGVLFENVFCSPFRMLGDEGEHLELQWHTSFGKRKGNTLNIALIPR